MYLIGVFVTFRGADCQGHVFPAEEGMRKKIKPVVGRSLNTRIRGLWQCVYRLIDN